MTRRDEILKLIVEHFIKTAEPVGSKTLQEVYHLDVSSATIRNEMNALEQDGYLEKTHTSSGRVPSEKGYQYYAEHIRETSVDEGAKNALANVLSEKSKSVEEVMKESCEILSHMTNLASVVLGPSVNEEKLVSVQIIPLGENTATAVFVTDKGYVENKTFLIDPTLKTDEVVKTVKLLNDRLQGTPISEVVTKMEAMKPALTDYVVGQEVIYDAILEAFAKFATDRLALYGKDALYNQPEYANDAEKLRQLLQLLDDPENLKKALGGAKTSKDGISIHIGTAKEGLEDLAVVSAGVSLPGDPNCSLTVLGPSRMDYEKVVSTLRYFAEALDEYFARSTIHGGEENAWQKMQKKVSPKPQAKPAARKKK
jgi:heat-inducible transcriptional repressor